MNKFLKISTGILAGFSSLAFAGTMGDQVAPSNYSFFIGATAGMGMYDGTYRALNPAVADTHFSQNGGDSFLGGGLIGVETQFNNFYVALVANAMYNSLSEDVRVSTNGAGIINHGVAAKNNFQYGGSVRLGTNIWNATPYIMGGVEAGKWDMTLTNNSLVNNRGIPPLSSTTFSEDLVGPQAGVGIMLNAANNMEVGLEVAHTWFGTINTTLVTPAGAVWQHRMKVQQNQAMVSFNYKFDLI